MYPELHSSLCQLFGTERTASHSSIWQLSSSSFPAIQILSLCSSKAQCDINKSPAQQVMEDKQRHVWDVQKLVVCVRATAAAELVVLLLCEERGAAEEALCEDTLAERVG